MTNESGSCEFGFWNLEFSASLAFHQGNCAQNFINQKSSFVNKFVTRHSCSIVLVELRMNRKTHFGFCPALHNLGINIDIKDNYLYTAGFNLNIVNISNPLAPVITSSLTITSNLGAADISVDGSYACLAYSENGLVIVDVRRVGQQSVPC